MSLFRTFKIGSLISFGKLFKLDVNLIDFQSFIVKP